jgi:mannose-6-phosphate isomerase
MGAIETRLDGAAATELPRTVPKPWGHELWFAHTDRYAGKLLHVKAGHRLSVQYHERKDETSYLLAGRLLLSQGTEAERLSGREIGPGTAWRNTPRLVHTIEALDDAVIVEVSTPELDDVVRIEDRYGRTDDQTVARGAR